MYQFTRKRLSEQRKHLYLPEEALFQELRQNIIGQDEVLRVLARLVSRHLTLRTPSRPATLFMIGPRGVGKTRTAECLVPALRTLNSIGTDYRYWQLDMSEYQEYYPISQLQRAPQGYLGFEDKAQRIDMPTVVPEVVILFDEIEKAHVHIIDDLTNKIEYGQFSLPYSATAMTARACKRDYCVVIFMFTCNLNAASIINDIQEQQAFSDPIRTEKICREHLYLQGMAPELIRRIDTFLVFQPLTWDARAAILTYSIVRAAQEYGLHIANIQPSVITAILELTRDRGSGVRPALHLMDDLLGEAFSNAALNYPHILVEVCGGPPFECVPYTDN